MLSPAYVSNTPGARAAAATQQPGESSDDDDAEGRYVDVLRHMASLRAIDARLLARPRSVTPPSPAYSEVSDDIEIPPRPPTPPVRDMTAAELLVAAGAPSPWDPDPERGEAGALSMFFLATGGSESWLQRDGWVANEFKEARVRTAGEQALYGGGDEDLGVPESTPLFGVTTHPDDGLVRVVNFRSNDLTGTLPAKELSCLSAMTSFTLVGHDCLTGPLPLKYSTTLVNLNMASNALEGRLPAAYSELRCLKTLSLRNNCLTGGVPAEWAEGLDCLASLNISSNDLTEPLPPALPAGLVTVRLKGNFVSGHFPESLAASVPRLKFLDVRDNSLEGVPPATLGDLEHLETLYMTDNAWDVLEVVDAEKALAAAIGDRHPRARVFVAAM